MTHPCKPRGEALRTPGISGWRHENACGPIPGVRKASPLGLCQICPRVYVPGAPLDRFNLSLRCRGGLFMRTTILIPLLVSLVAPAPYAGAQQTPTGPPTAKAVSFDDIVKMVSQGKDAPAILDSCDTIFTLSVEEREK